MGSRGFLWDRLWEVKILWVRIMGVTLVIRKLLLFFEPIVYLMTPMFQAFLV